MTKFRLFNFGCRTSQAEGAALKGELLQAGLVEADGIEHANVAVLNTCTVTAPADAEARQIIRRIRRQNPACQILVTGCYAQRAAEEIAQLSGVRWVVGNSHKHTLADILRAFAEEREIRPDPPALSPTTPADILVGLLGDEFHFTPVDAGDRTRPVLKVQDGCDAHCSYCIVPSVRGRSRSLAPGKVVEQTRQLEQEGFLEIVLSGINLGTYGRDLSGGFGLRELLEQILAATSAIRLRLSSLEMVDVTSRLIDLVAREPRMAKHFHLPLQSGSDRVLEFMNRPYTAAEYVDCLLAIHQQLPNCGVGADVMAGFPGEDADDHVATLQVIDALPFTYLHVFPYSIRPGTVAASLAGAVDGRVARERAEQIRNIMREKRARFLNSQVGCQLQVLTLHEARGDFRLGLSGNFLQVAVAGSVPANRMVVGKVQHVQDGLLYASI